MKIVCFDEIVLIINPLKWLILHKTALSAAHLPRVRVYILSDIGLLLKMVAVYVVKGQLKHVHV